MIESSKVLLEWVDRQTIRSQEAEFCRTKLQFFFWFCFELKFASLATSISYHVSCALEILYSVSGKKNQQEKNQVLNISEISAKLAAKKKIRPQAEKKLCSYKSHYSE